MANLRLQPRRLRDQPASCQLEVAKDKCAEGGCEIDSVAAVRLIHDFYVDDYFTGGSLEEVNRFRGNRRDDGFYDGTLTSRRYWSPAKTTRKPARSWASSGPSRIHFKFFYRGIL